MARRSSLRFPITVSFENTDEDIDKLLKKRKLATNILQSSNVNFSSWNRTSLLTRVSSFGADDFGVFFFQTQKLEERYLVALGTKQELNLNDLFSAFADSNTPAIIFLLVENIDEMADELKVLPCGNIALILIDHSISDFAFALACEITNFKVLRTVNGNKGTVSTMVNAIQNILESMVVALNTTRRVFLGMPPSLEKQKKVLWESDVVFAKSVDIDKIRTTARKEQIDDTVKRLLDASQYPRSANLRTKVRMISSQAILWLSQVTEFIDIDDWIASSTLFLEVYPEFSTTAPASRYTVRERPNKRHLVALLDNFIYVCKGKFVFGRDDSNIPSEPPAKKIEAQLPGYWISRHLVTESAWLAVFEGEISNGPAHPVNQVSYFDAVEFCNVVSQVLQKELVDRFGNCRICIPSEYQWEAAARGPNSLYYPWGKKYIEENCNANMRIAQSTEVAKFSPSGDSFFGCSDMSGNLREWTSSYAGTPGNDWQEHSVDRVLNMKSSIDPMSRLVIRGGSYSYDPECVQTWVRNTQIATRFDKQTGFRLAVENE